MTGKIFGGTCPIAWPSLVGAGLLASVLSAGCGGAAVTAGLQPPRAVGDVWVFVPAVPGSIVEAEVTGADMDSPIATELAVEGNLASGVIDEVEEGPSRSVLLTARSPSGQVCSCSVPVAVRAGQVTKVDGPALECIDPARQTAARGGEDRISPVAALR